MTSRRWCALFALILGVMLSGPAGAPADGPQTVETPAEFDARMKWWREARFGMFIHWGLYAEPAGEWGDRTNHAEWIRTTAEIPVEEYEKLRDRFNPVRFDARAWARMARDAGMRYIVITSKHHDGFCLFDSELTDWDVMSTPFRRDILKELSEATRAEELRLCFYHSIMDWHHPDYLPRRPWEAAQRSAEGADFDRYVTYMKGQLRELLTKYGPIGVLWFDGEWEDTWTHERGRDLYAYVRGLQPQIIVNNRVDVGRSGMAGLTRAGSFAGDFGTPEQEIPSTGLPGVDWETCMTMNDNWGYNRADLNYKSTTDLLRKLADIASKGGNFLLNIGPTAAGEFPPESIARLREIGAWMKVNGDAIYGTQASPFRSLAWGRCTQKPREGGTRLYLHVFEWPSDGQLIVPGLLNEPAGAHLLADAGRSPLTVTRAGDALTIAVPRSAPDMHNSVVVLDIAGKADVGEPPRIQFASPIYHNRLPITVSSDQENVELRYTMSGAVPTADSPIYRIPVAIPERGPGESFTLCVRAFRQGRAVSPPACQQFTRATLRPAAPPDAASRPGVTYEYYEGRWDRLPDFDSLTPARSGVVEGFMLQPRQRSEEFGFRYRGYIRVPEDEVYQFALTSDDGSRLYIGDELVVDNDGPHGMLTRTGLIALSAGLHPITVLYFERDGGDGLEVLWGRPGKAGQAIPTSALLHP